MIVLTFIFLFLFSDCRVINDNDPEPNDVIIVKFHNRITPKAAKNALSDILKIPPGQIFIAKHESNNNTISFTVSQTDDNNLTQEGIIALLSTSPLLTIVNDKDAETTTAFPSAQFWTKPWVVVIAAIVAGLVVFLIMVPPIYLCLKKRKGEELEKIDSRIVKRYDTMGRDGSIQSRRKLAPNTLTLTPLTQQSTESSDSDSSPPGIKEALQSRTNPLTPLQLRQRLDNPALLYAEFSSMPTNEETRTVKKSSMKNRYKGVLPNIHTRVKLKTVGLPDDYINANYLKGYKGLPRVYIGTQGPLKNTVNDFWRMIWQENVNTIVMITKLQEKGRNKCAIYWPDSVGTYGKYTVTVRDSTEYEGFTVTSMLITDGVEVHRLCHLWMWSWPDQGVPDSSRTLLAVLSCVHSIWQIGSSPLVVHCSAGLGRTGCFIAVDIGIQALKHDRVVDVLKIVASMRLDRGGMVQTLEQYEFIHRALLRHEVSTRNKNRYKGLRQASFSHEGPPEALYAQGVSRRMSYYKSSYTSHALDIASTSLPTYISPLLAADHPEIPSPDSPKPPSLLQLSQLMEKSSKRKLFKRTTAVDFSSDVNYIEHSPPKHSPPKHASSVCVPDESSPDQFLKTPPNLTKSSFSLDLGRLEKAEKQPLPRSASEDTPEYGAESPREPFSSKSINMPYFTFDFETIPEPESPLNVTGGLGSSAAGSPVVINS
ncbi:hypothetical protein ACHWQZ_G015423 [Mnemiopsis leidyi]